LKIDTEISEISFVIFTRIFNRVNVERYGESVDRQDYGLSFAVDKDLQAVSACNEQARTTTYAKLVNIGRQSTFSLIALELFPAFALLSA
jgi:hypothetical protein